MKLLRNIPLIFWVLILILFFISCDGDSPSQNQEQIQQLKNTYFDYPLRDYPIGKTEGSDFYWTCSDNDFCDIYSGKFHSGEDWNLKGGNTSEIDEGKPIYSIGEGRVIYSKAERDRSGNDIGFRVVIEHTGTFIIPAKENIKGSGISYKKEVVDKIYSVYLHLKDVQVEAGNEVTVDTVIGYITRAGAGSHLHFEIRKEKEIIYNSYFENIQQIIDFGFRDPSEFIEANIKGKTNGYVISESLEIPREMDDLIEGKLYDFESSVHTLNKETFKVLFAPTIDWLYYSEAVFGLCIVDSDGSNLKRFSNVRGHVGGGTISPDDSKISYHRKYGPGGSIYIMDIDGSNLKEIHKAGFDPFFSKDSKRILFISEEEFKNYSEICTMDLNGGDIRKILRSENNSYYSNPKYSNDGSKIMFITSNYESNPESVLNIINNYGSDLREIINKNNFNPTSASFSPDDSKIVFSAYNDDYYNQAIYILNLENLEIQEITDNKSFNFGPYFSPEGNKIIFESNRNGFCGLYMMNIDGTYQEFVLSSDYVGSHNPTFSLDGTKIAFESNMDGNPEIYIVDSDGTNLERLTNNEVFDGLPIFSPDGEKVLFFSCNDGSCGIWLKTLNNSESVKIDEFELDDRGVMQEWYRTFKPIFSPNGEKILYFTSPNESENFCIINVDGMEMKRLDAQASFYSFSLENNKVFSADSKKIYFIGNSEEIFSINIENDLISQLTDDELIKDKLFFSKDNNKVLFTAHKNNVQNSYDYYIMNSDGSNIEKLSSIFPELLDNNKIPLINENGVKIVDVSKNDLFHDYINQNNEKIVYEEEPKFSPDGSKIVYVAYGENGIPNLYIINSDGTQERKLILR